MTGFTPIKEAALTSDELDNVAGGIIIVGGIQQLVGLQQRFTSPLDRVAINPQPLPPKIMFGF